VCADTSPFLNGTIHLSFYPFLYHLFRWLQDRSTVPSPHLIRWISSVGLVILLLLGWRLGGVGALRFIVIAIVLGLFATRYVSIQPLRPAREDAPLAILDFSHLPKWATDPFQRRSVDGLAGVLLRSGYLPVTMWRFDPSLLSRAKLVVVNEPESSYSSREKKALDDWVRAGGRLIIGGSYETPDAVNELLQSTGVQIQKVPLGSAYFKIDYFGSQEYVHIPNTAPITYREAANALAVQYSSTVLAENEGYPVAVRVRLGGGMVLLLASDRFLTSESLEDKDNARRGVNVVWLENTIKDAFSEVSN
jgi:hypothetical protein